ncbi:flagellar basal body protein FliL [Aerophototrophica crusticola]|uniref:Flagellar protein FliL n=1 Tax=Aerophototrophica crusticola TaxID=1709002 RepID=A0A858R6I5_9PROT|nr:flagellar basal body protein FliL [Rhodospirillaceae bacterium B3]
MTALDTDGGTTEQELPRKKFAGKKIVLFIVLPILFVVGGGAALFFTGILDSLLGKHEEHAEEHAAPPPDYTGPPVFRDLPDILVNLNTGDRRSTLLKLGITLELSRPEDQAQLDTLMPRINDSFQVYLRELRVEDLRGSAGLHRLREELLMRVNMAAAPLKVKDVLIKEFLVQ